MGGNSRTIILTDFAVGEQKAKIPKCPPTPRRSKTRSDSGEPRTCNDNQVLISGALILCVIQEIGSFPIEKTSLSGN